MWFRATPELTALQARDGKITMEDLAGGNITLSNAGMFGSFLGTPIINLAQTAVLGIYGIKERPVAVNGKVEIRPVSCGQALLGGRLN